MSHTTLATACALCLCHLPTALAAYCLLISHLTRLPTWWGVDVSSGSRQVIKLSDAVQPLPRQTTQFVHGVPDSFLRVGERKAQAPSDGGPRFTRGAYFMGKAVWAKARYPASRCQHHSTRSTPCQEPILFLWTWPGLAPQPADRLMTVAIGRKHCFCALTRHMRLWAAFSHAKACPTRRLALW